MLTGVKITAALSRTIYIEVPDKASKDDIKKEAEKDLVLPTKGIQELKDNLRRAGINIPKMAIEDWMVENVKYKIIK